MATFHFNVKPGKVGSAEAHCEYINREGRYANGKRKEELVYKANSQLPYWAKDINQFYEYADGFERANGNAYYKFEVGLPAELSLEENVKLVYQLVDEHIGKNKVWCFAIHDKMGIPTLTVVLTVLHAGGKFGGGGYKVSGGLHGVGASVTNALSEWLKVQVYKGTVYQMEFSSYKDEKTGKMYSGVPKAPLFNTGMKTRKKGLLIE